MKTLAVLCLQSFAGVLAALGNPGDLDPTFDPSSGIDGYVAAAAVQADGRVIIAGSFTTTQGLMRDRIARLNPDGTGDASFHLGPGQVLDPRMLLWCAALQPDGKVLIGGNN